MDNAYELRISESDMVFDSEKIKTNGKNTSIAMNLVKNNI